MQNPTGKALLPLISPLFFALVRRLPSPPDPFPLWQAGAAKCVCLCESERVCTWGFYICGERAHLCRKWWVITANEYHPHPEPHSSVHKGPFTHSFPNLWTPKSPGQNHTLSHSFRQSLKTPKTDVRTGRQMHTLIKACTLSPTHMHIKSKSRNRLFFSSDSL